MHTHTTFIPKPPLIESWHTNFPAHSVFMSVVYVVVIVWEPQIAKTTSIQCTGIDHAFLDFFDLWIFINILYTATPASPCTGNAYFAQLSLLFRIHINVSWTIFGVCVFFPFRSHNTNCVDSESLQIIIEYCFNFETNVMEIFCEMTIFWNVITLNTHFPFFPSP